jgi:hypothetical protein
MEKREARHGTLYFRRKYYWAKVMVPKHRTLKQYVGDNARKVLTRLVDADGETAVFEL